MSDPLYEVLSPIGERMGGAIPPAAPLSDLNGKKLGLIWTVFTNGNVLLEALAELLAKRYRGIEFLKLPPGRNARWGDQPDQTLAAFARDSGIDAAIVAVGC